MDPLTWCFGLFVINIFDIYVIWYVFLYMFLVLLCMPCLGWLICALDVSLVCRDLEWLFNFFIFKCLLKLVSFLYFVCLVVLHCELGWRLPSCWIKESSLIHANSILNSNNACSVKYNPPPP